MGYYFRFFDTRDEPLSLEAMGDALKEFDADYDLSDGLHYGGDLYGLIEINAPGDGLFEEEIKELLESLSDLPVSHARSKVESALRNARRTIAIQVLWQGRPGAEDTLAMLDPLLDWLFIARDGLLQADGEGYYDEDGLILEIR